MLDFGSIFITADNEEDANNKIDGLRKLFEQIENQDHYFYNFSQPGGDYRDDVWEYEFIACDLHEFIESDKPTPQEIKLEALRRFPIHTYMNCDDANFYFDTNIKGYDDCEHIFNGIKLCHHDIYKEGI